MMVWHAMWQVHYAEFTGGAAVHLYWNAGGGGAASVACMTTTVGVGADEIASLLS